MIFGSGHSDIPDGGWYYVPWSRTVRLEDGRRVTRHNVFRVWSPGNWAGKVGRDDQTLIDRLAILAQPRRNVHRIAEIGELAFGSATFADDHRSGVQPGAEVRHDTELAVIVDRE